VPSFDCIIVDEAHGSRARQLSDILSISEAKYKIGCTGTLPDDQIEL
jgi:superfamily II DNA or RNA helicase